jgi:hypothetical protein
MKRKLIFNLIALFVLSTTLVSCGKDDDGEDNFTVDKQSITLVHDGTETIIATKTATWTSDNEFVASVDNNGVVTGNHIGEATITAISSGQSKTVKVTVKPKYNTITEPIMDFDLSKSEIKSKISGTPDTEEDYKLNYKISKSELLMYTFDESTGKLESCAWGSIDALSIVPSELVGFLTERYQPITSKDNYYFFANSNKLETATMVVTFTITKGNLLIMYSPYEHKATSKASVTEYEKMMQF